MVWAMSDEELETRVKTLSNELRCPTCQGLSVQESEAGFSLQMRQKVKELLQSGKSDDDVKAYFVERYGDWILRAPPRQGFNLLLWGLPGVLILLALGLVLRQSRKWVKTQETRLAQPAVAPLTPEEQAILNTDMQRFQNS